MDRKRYRGNVVLRVFGEFSIIVLGVLVALGVDAWVEGREADRLEGTLLESLVADLKSGLVEMQTDNQDTEARVATLTWALSLPIDGSTSFPADSLGSVSTAVNWTQAYAPRLRTYETLIATGSFDLISSRAVQLALGDVKASSDVYADYRAQATDQWNLTYSKTWTEYMGQEHNPDAPFGLPGQLPTPDVDAALRDRFFRGVINRRRIFLYFVVENGAALVAEMETALALIEAEIEARSG